MANSRFHELKPSNTAIIVADLLVFSFTFLVGAKIAGSHLINHGDISFYIHLIIFSLPLQLSILAVGLYNEKLRETFRGITIRIMVSVTLGYLLTTIAYEITTLETLPSNFNELLFSSTFVMLVITRYIALKIQYGRIGCKRVLVLGAGERASIIEKCMRRKSDRVGVDFVGFIPISGDIENRVKKETVFSLSEPLESFVINHRIDEIVIAADERRGTLPINSLFHCKHSSIVITDIIDFVERETGQIAVNYIYPSWIIYNGNNSASLVRRSFEWLFNCSIAVLILFFTWPFMAITTLLIKLEDGLRAPVLYSQKRTGLNGKTFDIYKFRSMYTDAEKDGVKWAEKRDPRVTKVGNFIRKYRIDELPQLYNVIRGDMDFVGPRPERPQFTEQFEVSIPFYNHRLNVKPGLTGWAQLKYPYGSSKEDALEKLKFDLYYIKHRSIILDMLILLKTSEVILFGKGR